MRFAAHATIAFSRRYRVAPASCSQSVPINLCATWRPRSWAQPGNRTIEKRSKRRSKINNLREKWTWEQLGNRTRRTRGKTRIRADQKARRDNNLVIADPVCKTSTPGSNPGGASTYLANSTISHLASRRSSYSPHLLAIPASLVAVTVPTSHCVPKEFCPAWHTSSADLEPLMFARADTCAELRYVSRAR